MNRLTRLLFQLPRLSLCWGLSLVQGIGLATLFITLIFPPGRLLSAALADEAVAEATAGGLTPLAFVTTSQNIAPKPHVLGTPVRRGPVAKDKWNPLAKRQPNEKGLYKSGVSLRALDLKKVPSEADLRLAGQMGSPLTPTADAEPSKIADPVKRKRQEGDNMLFGQAIQKWNQHDYKGAVALFNKHRMTYADSPWAGEAELHLGCEAQFTGNWEEARVHFEQVLSAMPKGSDMYQKVKLRRAVLHMDQGELDLAAKAFTELIQSETDWQRRTYEQRWLLDLSHFRSNQVALRTCGSNSIAYVLRSQGKNDVAANVASMVAPSEQGFSLRELTDLATKVGLSAVAVRADGNDDLERLPVPFVAHYRDQHFVVVKSLAENGDVQVYDPRLEHETQLNAESFRAQWSELAILFQAKPEGVELASNNDLDQQMGGCCGIPRYPGDLGGNPGGCGMPGWSVNPVNLNVCVQDIPMWHDNQFGQRVEIKLTYNSQDSLVQMRPVGNKWVLNYASYAMESPGAGGSPGTVLVVMPDGRGDIYQPKTGGGYTPPAGVFNTLSKSADPYTFDVGLPDGTTYHYSVPHAMGTGSYSSLLVSITDRYGSAVTISHNSDGSIYQVADPLNQQWTFFYNAQGYLDHINDPFGRQATFSYDASGNLTGQTDMGSVAYGYTYDSNVDITSLIKPSGTTQFYIEPAQDGTQGTQNVSNGSNAYPAYGAPMWANYRVTVTDPQGYAEEYYWYGYGTDHHGWHRDQNQFQSPLPALQAPKTLFYCSQLGTNGKGVLSKIAYADGQYVQYAYGNNNSATNLLPSQVVQSVVLPLNGATAVNETLNLTYNAQGQVLTRQDARTYTTSYQYNLNGTVGNNGFDLATITDPLTHTQLTLGYDSARNVKSITDATSNKTQIDHNTLGQRSVVTNAAQHAFAYNYDNTTHRLTSITQGTGQNIVTLRSLSYDGVGRVQTDTDVDGRMLIYEYDGLDRLKRTIYPDGTDERYNYSCCWLESQTDRIGRKTSFIRDFRGKPLVTSQADGTLVQTVYDPVGNLIELVDGNGHATQLVYDARNRVANKIYADGSTYSFVYDGVGNLTTRTDAKNVMVNYTYDLNNNLTGITAPGLTPITYAYDERNWVYQMTDGVGTTGFGYDLAGRRNSITGPLDNDAITLIYDAMGRVGTQTVNGQQSTFTYADSLERLTSSNTPIGNFTYTYRSAVSPQLASVSYPNGQSTTLSYYGADKDNRLSQITNSTSGGLLSQFDYEYDAAGQITTWKQQAGSGHKLAYGLQQDTLGQLTGATVTDTVTNAVTQTYGYGYDNAGNRVTEQTGASLSQDAYNDLNQLTGRQGNGVGAMPFRGVVNKPSTVKVNGSQVPNKADGSFATMISVAPGNNNVAVSATDRNNNTASQSYQIAVAASGDSRTLLYDANGNLQSMTVSGVTSTYDWDALDRLTAINQGNNRSEFLYDGMSRRCQIIEKNGSSVASNKHFTWLGMSQVEERDVTHNVTKRFCGQGEQIGGHNYFYSRDHLGSVREMVDGNTQAICARYNYDLYGVRSVNLITGNTIEADFGFTGHYFHQPSGLHLAPYRAYSAQLGRWINRDPIAEAGGINIYQYANNQIASITDPTGLLVQGVALGGVITLGGGAAAGGTGFMLGTPVGIAIAAGASLAVLGFAGGYMLGEGIASFIPDPAPLPPDTQAAGTVGPPRKPPCNNVAMAWPGENFHNHHWLPQEFRDWFEAAPRNLDIDAPEFREHIPMQWHTGEDIGLHSPNSLNLNARWGDFIRENPGASRAETLDFMRQQQQEWGSGY